MISKAESDTMPHSLKLIIHYNGFLALISVGFGQAEGKFSVSC